MASTRLIGWVATGSAAAPKASLVEILLEWEEVVRPRDAGDTPDRRSIITGGSGDLRRQGEHHRVVGPGRMPGHEGPVGVTAMRRRNLAKGGQRHAAIDEEVRVAHFGHQPVVRHRRHIAQGGEGPPGEPVIRLPPAPPGTAIDEEQQGMRPAAGCLAGGHVDVEALARQRPVGQVGRGELGLRVLRHQRVEHGDRPAGGDQGAEQRQAHDPATVEQDELQTPDRAFR